VKTRVALLATLLALSSGCSALRLVGYTLFPDYPEFEAGEQVEIDGLGAEVEVSRRPDGLWRISAQSLPDAMTAVGYLQARDRMAQLDIFRHFARGELAELVGNRAMGGRSALDTDRLNRFLGFRDRAEQLWRGTSPQEQQALAAFARGVNRWIDEGRLSLEHRLLGVDSVRAWTPQDSLAIYQLIMHGLGGNDDREIRRLAIACEAGLDALERIWPHDVEFDVVALPEENLRRTHYPARPAVAPELASELPELCAAGAADTHVPTQHTSAVDPGVVPTAAGLAALLADGWTASNNWAVAGRHTASGSAIVSSDPHLPHMNPPIMWGMELSLPGLRVAGFTLPGLHRVVFGHNGFVAFGATTNHVDPRDLVVHRPRTGTREGLQVPGSELDGRFVPFEYRTETFLVRGSEPVRVTVRFTEDGPLVNDFDAFVAGRIPLTALRRVPLGRGRDLDGARAVNRARTAEEFARAISLLDLGCASWVFADVHGHIGYRSPCLVPVREHWRGTFPAPGWLSRYRWQGFMAKDELPASDDPERGWLATANNQIVPSSRFPTSYNNDASSPNRFLRIARRLQSGSGSGGLTAETSAAIQMDIRYEHWASLRRELEADFCAHREPLNPDALEEARSQLCAWDGAMDADSVAATLYTLLTNAALDRALADELPGDSGDEVWRYAQSLLQFEANVAWLWTRPEAAAVWNDVRTGETETRSDILEAALADAVALASRRWGTDPDRWTWGSVRPFQLRHLFASKGGALGMLFNSHSMPISGGTETPFKQQFPRVDREHMVSAVGPVVRFTVDMADPWAATYSLAGGESGWPRSPHYADLLDDWLVGRGRPLTPAPSDRDLRVRLVPRAGS
jgi:penicillin amidase